MPEFLIRRFNDWEGFRRWDHGWHGFDMDGTEVFEPRRHKNTEEHKAVLFAFMKVRETNVGNL